ncbi:hypothetical protein GCM10020367_61080 [Streptomyces sannanensis]|uniref:Uncharacterized protein n=1 Tax=Streptomyces sannanensis TaxID=285536 RepID=A0ABP6SL96_9ACTN
MLGEPAHLRTECLLRADTGTDLSVRVRFLHLVDRKVLRDGHAVDSLTVDGRCHLAWQEATERDLRLPPTTVGALLDAPLEVPLLVPGGTHREELADRQGQSAGELLRTWEPLTGTTELAASRVDAGTVRISVRITNTTDCPRPDPENRQARELAVRHALLSTHTVLRSERGTFVSLADPPEELRDAARSCDNQGCWPALVGEGDERGHTVLSSPITLPDYPQVAPESPGDLFDGTEIDQLLILSVLSMSEQEREEMAATDPRARDILERCAALGERELGALHGAIRSFRPLEDA